MVTPFCKHRTPQQENHEGTVTITPFKNSKAKVSEASQQRHLSINVDKRRILKQTDFKAYICNKKKKLKKNFL